MAKKKTIKKSTSSKNQDPLHFDVSTGLKRVLGRELITNDEVAIFELVKNSFDAGANSVHIHFGKDSIVIADNGSGMSYQDLKDKWLFVAYSAKRSNGAYKDFRDVISKRSHYAGSKGIGRFSSDRISEEVVLQTRSKAQKTVHKLTVDWGLFEDDDKEHFEKIPVEYRKSSTFKLPKELQRFSTKLKHGTVIELRNLKGNWDRDALINLKSSLAKLINPFGVETDGFSIFVSVPAEKDEDKKVREKAKRVGEEPPSREIVNGRVGNFIFSDLQEKTTFINVEIIDEHIETSLTDRGELIYKIREPNPYKYLEGSAFHCEMYYLNTSAKQTFARRVGLPSIQFGSVFLFRNEFRVYPIGEDGDDWFGFNRRKQQGFARFLGTRELIGRVDVFGSDDDFQEASSRNQGLIETPAVKQLQKAVMDRCLKRLENYVVPVSWIDTADGESSDLSRLLTEPGRARVTEAVGKLVGKKNIELVEYSKRLIGLLNERSSEFESSLASLRPIALKANDKKLLSKLDKAEKRFKALRKSEAEARKIADLERVAAEKATKRAETAEEVAQIERRRSHFLESVVNIDTSTILNLHHQVTIYAVDIAQQIENLLSDTAGQKNVPREMMLEALEQMAFLNKKVLSVTKFAAKANFKLDSEKIDADLPSFISDYIDNIAKKSGSARMKIDVITEHSGMKLKFNPIDISIIVDNLISNAKRAKAARIKFEILQFGKNGLMIKVSDNSRQGLARGADPDRIFEMGYTTTGGSGLGLYHVRQVLGEMGGSIELADPETGKGTCFIIKITPGRKK